MRHLGYWVVATALSCATGAAMGQSAADSTGLGQSSADSTSLQEIIVTAQRREQNLQDVPVSVTVFKGDDLLASGETGAAAYLAMTPNVGFSEDASTGSRGINISIRGVSDLKTGQNSVAPSIGEYLDGFSVASSPYGLYNPQVADVDQIEVLRGPQGTYFGRNSLGGALNITTKKPTDKFEGYVTGNFEDFNGPGAQESVTGVLNTPITDSLKMRNVFYYEDSTGMVKNIAPVDGEGTGHTYYMGRNAIQWDIDSATTLDTVVIYDHENQGADETVPSGVWSVDTVDGYNLGVTNLTHAVNQGTGFWPQNTTERDTSGPEHNDIRQLTAVANLSHKFTDDLVLKAVAGLLHGSINRLQDGDSIGDWENFTTGAQSWGQSYSGEVRLEYNSEPLTWVGGLIYADDKSVIKNFVLASTDTSAPLSETGPSPDGVVLLPPLPPGLCFECEQKHFDDKSEALFTELTWRPLHALELIVGGRFTHDQVSSELQTFGPIYPTVFALENTGSGDVSFNDFAPKAGVVYKFTDDLRYYATVSKGYKAGGTSLGFNPSPKTVPLPSVIEDEFRPEKLWSYETGLKTEWLDHRLRVNGDIFYSDWKDLQLEVFRFLVPGDLSSKFALTTNFPSARAKGAEIEFAAAVTHGLSITGSAGYLDSEITNSGIQQLSGGFLVNLAGLPMPNSPRFTADLGAEQRWTIGNGEGWVKADYVHRGSQFSNVEALVYQQIRGQFLPSHAPGSTYLPAVNGDGFPFKVPSYDVVNLSSGYNWKSFETTLYVQNLFGEKYYTGTAESYGLSGILLRPHPRIIGLTLTYRFGK